MNVSEFDNRHARGPVRWYGYAIEAIYIVLATMLVAIVLGILIYR